MTTEAECHEGNHGRCWYCELGRKCPAKALFITGRSLGKTETTSLMVKHQLQQFQNLARD